jgi:DMSO/TMAO reductase YedYZ molybdopterin-dependent catalytic subunit
MSLSRRDLLRAAPLAAVGLPGGFTRFGGIARADGMIVRQQEPQNLETPPAGLEPWLTPTEQFYVRNHFAIPKLDPDGYTLAVTGHVANPLSLSLADLARLPQVTLPLTLECAGNGRVFLVPQVRGAQWGIGGVSTAEWSGVPLGAVLEMAKVKSGAAEVVLVGKDTGTITTDPQSPGPIAFDRSLPLAKAKKDECVLATGMNKQPLPVAHGAPVRAVVGGWYGMASVKWLVEVRVTDKPYAGFWQTMDYSHWDRKANGRPEVVPITEIQPKAIIVRPGLDEVAAAGKEMVVSGKAWAGENRVAKVEFSSDGGASWAAAKLAGEEKNCCWRDWSFAWTPKARGPAKLVARCTDDKGRTQPDKRDPDRRTYMINHLVATDVAVK